MKYLIMIEGRLEGYVVDLIGLNRIIELSDRTILRQRSTEFGESGEESWKREKLGIPRSH